MKRRKRILLVQPDFPIPAKRKINHDFLPIGLMKIGSYLRNCKHYDVTLVLGNSLQKHAPDEIWITSLFTYWSDYVHESARFYRSLYPKAKMRIGGIYATLLPEDAKKHTNAEISKGLHMQAEEWCDKRGVDYSLLGRNVDFQIMHGMRGCFRRCKFCGTWRLEPKETYMDNMWEKIVKNHVVFYDNNFLRHPEIKTVLKELSNVRVGGRHVVYESQSGFDGRILDQEIADMLKRARFKNPRIAWDNSLEDEGRIESQIDMLVSAGYARKDIYVFMLFNWDYDYAIMEQKRQKCWSWKVQIADCRFRPLDQMYDRFDSRKRQSSRDYFIHHKWTDEEIKLFRSNVRRHNICVRHDFRFHSRVLEQMKLSKKRISELNRMSRKEVKKALPDAWFPDEYHDPYPNQAKIDGFLGSGQVSIKVVKEVAAE